MKLPSLDYIITQSRSTLQRFPIALASAMLASAIAIYLISLSGEQLETVSYLLNVVLVSVLGIPLFIGLSLISEKRDWSPLILNGMGILLLLAYYLSLPENLDNAPSEHLLRYMLYFLVVHLMVSIGPFRGKEQRNGFWQYNKTLFLRFLTAILFSGVLFAGLAVALGSIQMLFSITIEPETYLQLFFLIAGVFNTWFFLAGIPQPLSLLERLTVYPRGLKVFTQYILIPLVSVYLIILYCYTAKIIIEWNWPQGVVAYLVLSFSIVGILALLLLHPIRERVENQWIKRFSRSYFRALVPLVILLLLAIWVRIDEYNFTVNRYFVFILGIWLAGIVGYFIFSNTQNIKVIPASLALVGLFISFGPWGAFTVAERSQINRLQGYLQQNKILKDGRIRKASTPVEWEDRRQISSILQYLNSTHGVDGIQPWFEEDLSALTSKTDSSEQVTAYNRPEYIARVFMGIDYTLSPPPPAGSNTISRHFNAQPEHLVDVRPYDWLAQHISIGLHQSTDSLQLGNQTFLLSLAEDSLNLRLSPEADAPSGLIIPIGSLADTLFSKGFSASDNLPPEELSVETSNEQWQVKIYFRNLSLVGTADHPHLESAQLDLLLRIHSDDQ